MNDDRPDIEYERMKDDYDRQVDLRDEIESHNPDRPNCVSWPNHIQPNALDSLIESRNFPAMLRTWAAKLRERGIDAMQSPESYAVDFESMAGKIERDCNRLEYHLKTHIGKAVGSVVLHLNKEDDRCCAHCLVPMREHLSVDCLCAANVELSKELTDANGRLRYAEALSKSLLEDAKIIDEEVKR